MNRDRQYRVTRLIKSGRFEGFARFLRAENKKAGIKPAFPRIFVRNGSIRRSDRAAPVEAVVDSGLDGVLVAVEAGADDGGGTARERGAAEIVVHVLDLGGPVLREHVLEAGADGEAVAMAAVGRERHRQGGGGL